MPESMSISVNGHSQVPPGFRFHPTEEELLQYYLKKKVSYQKIDLDVIRDVDLNKLEPWDIQEMCRIGTTPQNDWYFFSHKDKKYPTGTRTNRATAAGFWKATGRDKVIYGGGRRIGMRKTLVFYKGRAPHGQKSDWIMHEYRLDDNTSDMTTTVSNVVGEASQEEGWVVCRIFKKKNLHKTLDSPLRASQMLKSCNEGSLDQILQHMAGRTCKEENEANGSARFLVRPIDHDAEVNYGFHQYHDSRFMKLPSLESPSSTSSQNCYQPMITDNEVSVSNQVCCTDPNSVYPMDSGLTNWVALDRLVASQLNGPSPTMAYCNTAANDHDPDDLQFATLRSSVSLPSIPINNRSYHHQASTHHHPQQDYNSEIELWNFTSTTRSSSSSDPLCHVSNSSL